MNQVEKPVVIKNTASYIAVNKPSGWLSQCGRTEETSVFEYFSNKNKNKVHLLNRIDRPVSGLLLLSKTRAFTKFYLESQDRNHIHKTYLAIVEGKVEKLSDRLEHNLLQDKQRMKSYVAERDNQNAMLCTLSFKRKALFDNYSLLQIKIKKGKYHQIRAQLAAYGHPIRGDVKYGARRGNRNRSIHLHSYKIDIHNSNDKSIGFSAPIWQGDNLWKSAAEMLK